MPYPNEHACRMVDPSEFSDASFRRVHLGSAGGHDAIMAKHQGSDSMTVQAFRYPTKDWTEARARAHCERHGGTFEPAGGGE